MTAASSTAAEDRKLPFGKDVEAFYDGGCPLCLREVAFLNRLDKLHRIQFTDIGSCDFDPRSVGKPMSELMSAMHGRLPDGTMIQGMEVLRRLYVAVGWNWFSRITSLPGLRQLCDAGYRVFARNRLRLTGRCPTRDCSINSGT